MTGRNLKINDEIRVVAFDFFDTIVHRRVHPEVVLSEWSKRLSEYFNYEVDPLEIYNFRKTSERELKKNCEEIKYSDLLLKIYNHFFLNSNSIQFLDFENVSFDLEKEVELKYIYLSKNIKSILDDATNSGAKVIIISDFYCGKKLLYAIIKKLNIDNYFSDVFVSSDIGRRKSTGSLYRWVIERLGIEANQLLMVGDNIVSDIKVPKSMGICTLSLPYKNPNVFYSGKDIYRKLKHISFKNLDDAPFNGYLGSTYFFVESLYRKLVKENVKDVLFCSREGQLLKKIFDIYQGNSCSGYKINTHYFYVSRKSTLTASLKNLEDEDFDSIFRQNDTLILSDFLDSLCFNSKEKNEIYNDSGLTGKCIVKLSENNSGLGKLLNDALFIEKYNKKRIEQKQLFQSYLKSIINIDIDKNLYIVDIGWRGSIQENIEYALKDLNVTVHGFYFGLILKDKTHLSENKKGIVFYDYPQKSHYFRIISKDYMIYERIFVANHGPVEGYSLDGTGAKPIIDNSKDQLLLYNFVMKYQYEFIEGFKRILKIMNISIYSENDLEEFVGKLILFQDCIVYPKNWQLEKSLRNRTKENFGNISKHRNIRKIIIKKIRKINFLFVDYAYKIPQSLFKSHILDLLSSGYCYVVYGIANMILFLNLVRGKK